MYDLDIVSDTVVQFSEGGIWYSGIGSGAEGLVYDSISMPAENRATNR